MNNLKQYRKKAGLSQAQLADLTQISNRTIQSYEQDIKPLQNARAITLIRMAKALNCSAEDLICIKDIDKED